MFFASKQTLSFGAENPKFLWHFGYGLCACDTESRVKRTDCLVKRIFLLYLMVAISIAATSVFAETQTETENENFVYRWFIGFNNPHGVGFEMEMRNKFAGFGIGAGAEAG